MEDVRIIRRRTHVWPVIVALVVLALVIAYVFFMMNSSAPASLGWNGLMEWGVSA
jgi:hypothetical protein